MIEYNIEPQLGVDPSSPKVVSAMTWASLQSLFRLILSLDSTYLHILALPTILQCSGFSGWSISLLVALS